MSSGFDSSYPVLPPPAPTAAQSTSKPAVFRFPPVSPPSTPYIHSTPAASQSSERRYSDGYSDMLSEGEQKACQTCGWAEEETESVQVTGLLRPIPRKLVEQVRNQPPENERNREMWTSMLYWDVVLKTKDGEMKAHRSVLAGCVYFQEQLRVITGKAHVTMPAWVRLRPLQIAVQFLYNCDIDREILDLHLSTATLQLAHFLHINRLVISLIIKHIPFKLTPESVLSTYSLSIPKDSDASTQSAWLFLMDYLTHYAGYHIHCLIQNHRKELLVLEPSLLIKTANAAFDYHYTSEMISQVVQLLVDSGLAQDVLQLSEVIYTHMVTDDTQGIDFLRPYDVHYLAQFPEDQVVEFESLPESDPWYLTTNRQNGPEIDATQPPKTPFSDLVNRPPHINLAISDFERDRSIVSNVFATESHTWFLTITLHSSNISLFLCERGPRNDSKTRLFTTVLWLVRLQTSTQTHNSVYLYSFPNRHFHCAGQRNIWSNRDIIGQKRVKISVTVQEIPLYSAVLHYLTLHFPTFNSSKHHHFKSLHFHDFYSVLSHNKLPVSSEKGAVSALWKYAANKNMRSVEFLVPAIRWEFVSIEDFCTVARDHANLRKSEHFRYIFAKEMRKRLENDWEIETEPRENYRKNAKMEENQAEKLVNWLLNESHHSGFTRQISENRHKFTTEISLCEQKSQELAQRKQELYLENERLQAEVQAIRVEPVRCDSSPGKCRVM